MKSHSFTSLAGRVAVALGAAGAILLAGPASAVAVTTVTDTVSEVHIETACGTHDDMSIVLYFHVDAAEGTSAGGRVAEVSATMQAPDLTVTERAFVYTMAPPEGAAYFATGDYTFDISNVFDRSTLDGDSVDANILLGNGEVAGQDSATVNCFNGTDATTVQNFEF